ncbi:MAG TPA: hypothetical protein VKP30_30650 [Polyangiaceae bacterium]|nr:hypothetical protein [Polyangiaceae bacterium]
MQELHPTQVPVPEPDKTDHFTRISHLSNRIARHAQVIRNLETNWIPELEKELEELQQVDLSKHPQPARLGDAADTAEMTVSSAMEVLTDDGRVACGVAVAGAIITTRSGDAFDELVRLNPNRKIIRVSLKALNERKAAGNAK